MYRENIFQFMKEGEKILFIPKNGGLNDYVINMLPGIGINVDLELKKRARGDVAGEIKQDDTTIVLARGEDIPQRVQEYNGQGKLAYGLTGDDLFDEFVLRQSLEIFRQRMPVVLNTYDWFDKKAEYKRPALCLMNRTGNIDDIPQEAKAAVNLKYQYTSEFYLSETPKKNGRRFKITAYAGDTESSVSDGTNDFCVEIVYGGDTRTKNGLEVLDIVRFSDIVLIGEDPDYFGKLVSEDLRQIIERKKNPKEGSYTTNLLKDRKTFRDKLISEAAEVFAAIEGKGDLVSELCDLIYATNIVVVGRNIDLRKIESELERRLK